MATLFLLSSLAAGVLAGLFLTALGLVLICVAYILVWYYMGTVDDDFSDEFLLSMAHIVIVFIAMWVTHYIECDPNWGWVTEMYHYVLGHLLR